MRNYDRTRGAKDAEPVYSAVFNNMQHLGFSDMKHMIPVKMLVGALDADVMHEGLCMLHSELFDTYLKKRKDRPDFKSSSDITVTEYKPDIS